jgi:S-formylglutathione hydrolase FrmB
MGPAILVFPDCFTAFGGNQYVNSSAIGDYADYLTREIIPFVDREFRTLASREHRGCFGKSSGGYGAIIHGMKHAKHWGAVACHSGDAHFDFVYWCDWPNTLNELAKHRLPKRKAGAYDARRESGRRGLAGGRDDGRIRRFLDHVWKKEKLTRACYELETSGMSR